MLRKHTLDSVAAGRQRLRRARHQHRGGERASNPAAASRQHRCRFRPPSPHRDDTEEQQRPPTPRPHFSSAAPSPDIGGLAQ